MPSQPVKIACQACRLSKVKCEQHPSGACGRCARLRLQCEHSTPAKRGRPAKAAAEHLPRQQQDLAVPQTGDEIEACTKQPHVETISALAAAVNEIVIAPYTQAPDHLIGMLSEPEHALMLPSVLAQLRGNRDAQVLLLSQYLSVARRFNSAERMGRGLLLAAECDLGADEVLPADLLPAHSPYEREQMPAYIAEWFTGQEPCLTRLVSDGYLHFQPNASMAATFLASPCAPLAEPSAAAMRGFAERSAGAVGAAGGMGADTGSGGGEIDTRRLGVLGGAGARAGGGAGLIGGAQPAGADVRSMQRHAFMRSVLGPQNRVVMADLIGRLLQHVAAAAAGGARPGSLCHVSAASAQPLRLPRADGSEELFWVRMRMVSRHEARAALGSQYVWMAMQFAPCDPTHLSRIADRPNPGAGSGSQLRLDGPLRGSVEREANASAAAAGAQAREGAQLPPIGVPTELCAFGSQPASQSVCGSAEPASPLAPAAGSALDDFKAAVEHAGSSREHTACAQPQPPPSGGEQLLSAAELAELQQLSALAASEEALSPHLQALMAQALLGGGLLDPTAMDALLDLAFDPPGSGAELSVLSECATPPPAGTGLSTTVVNEFTEKKL